jgi:SAM-dependent methyltransferase
VTVNANEAVTAYASFPGRFSAALAPVFVDAVAPTSGQRVLDVGCGSGALTEVLVERLGADAVAAADPSEAFVAGARLRLPGVEVRCAPAERLPYADDTFDLSLAQLVVHFMSDPERGVREMARVTRDGGCVAACVWDNAGGHGPLSPLWRAANELDPSTGDEGEAVGAREGQLAELALRAGLVEVRSTRLDVQVPFAGFEEWWQPLAQGVGSGGAYVTGLEESHRQALRERLEKTLGRGPFHAGASAWCVIATAPGDARSPRAATRR